LPCSHLCEHVFDLSSVAKSFPASTPTNAARHDPCVKAIDPAFALQLAFKFLVDLVIEYLLQLLILVVVELDIYEL
jgi:hypothetical protein